MLGGIVGVHEKSEYLIMGWMKNFKYFERNPSALSSKSNIAFLKARIHSQTFKNL